MEEEAQRTARCLRLAEPAVLVRQLNEAHQPASSPLRRVDLESHQAPGEVSEMSDPQLR